MEWPAHLPIVGGGGVSMLMDFKDNVPCRRKQLRTKVKSF